MPRAYISFKGDRCYKEYDIDEDADEDDDDLNYFKSEVEFYRLLNGFGVTPQLYAVEDNCLEMEKYEQSMYQAILSGQLTRERTHSLLVSGVLPLVERLHSLDICHGDLYLRNVVTRNNFTEFALIDFELSSLVSDGYRDLLTNEKNRLIEEVDYWFDRL